MYGNTPPIPARYTPVGADRVRDSHACTVRMLCKIEGALVMALGDRKRDIQLKDARTPDATVFLVAHRQGVLL